MIVNLKDINIFHKHENIIKKFKILIAQTIYLI